MSGPDLPSQMYWHCAAELEPGKVLVTGNLYPPYNTAFLYDLEQGSWSQVADLPEDKYGHSCGSAPDDDGGREGVVVGGSYGAGSESSSYAFSPKSGQWQRVDDYPPGVFGGASVLFGDSFAVAGGQSAEYLYLDAVYEYRSGSWVQWERGLLRGKQYVGMVNVDTADLLECTNEK